MAVTDTDTDTGSGTHGGPGAGRRSRRRTALTRREWQVLVAMAAFVVLLHASGWGVLALVAPKRHPVDSSHVFGVGLGLTAYTLGMRHAFDADHIAAIDVTTRKLMAEGRRPLSVGFWFSLGHASIVFVLVVLLAAGVQALAGPLEGNPPTLRETASMVGTGISGLFLYLIGILNLVVLVGIVKVFRRMRRGEVDEAQLEQQLDERGLMNRILSGATRAVSRPWQMFPVGLLFGLGFDTATEVALLVLAGGAAAFALPWYAMLTLPVLFAAGMSLFDTVDGCFMNFAYGWAFSKPVRKVYYNLTITGLSVAVALIVGTIELVSIVTEKLGIDSGPLAVVGNLDLNHVGYAIVVLFVVTWLVALAVWKYGRVEERWTVRAAAVDPADG